MILAEGEDRVSCQAGKHRKKAETFKCQTSKQDSAEERVPRGNAMSWQGGSDPSGPHTLQSGVGMIPRWETGAVEDWRSGGHAQHD